jgi:hypothetical protein
MKNTDGLLESAISLTVIFLFCFVLFGFNYAISHDVSQAIVYSMVEIVTLGILCQISVGLLKYWIVNKIF